MQHTPVSILLDTLKTELLRARDPRNERPNVNYSYALGLLHGARLGSIVTPEEHARLFALAKSAGTLGATKRPFPVTGEFQPF